MYKIETQLTADAIDSLESLLQEIEFKSNDIRPGVNAPEIMSVYTHAKWYDWNRQQKNTFKNAFGDHINTAVVGWFITFPESGFLDIMDYWQNLPSAGFVVAYSLTDNNSIKIGNDSVILQKGEGISFSLKELHEVSAESFERRWACVMQLQ